MSSRAATTHQEHAAPKRFRAFISYSQRDKATAKRIHQSLENYRIPKGISASAGPDRRLGRFFRDDDEMGAGQSLGAALEGALDDSENLIVICSPAAAQSKWVDAEVRRFKRRATSRVFAVIVAGEPHAADPSNECFPPALKTKIDADGNPTGEPDEPRAPDLRKEGLQRVRAQLAAGLLDVPFDVLWQRDRRRAMRNRVLASGTVLLVFGVLAVVGYGWLVTRNESQKQSAVQALSSARNAAADGRISEALTRLGPFYASDVTRELVEQPLRALLGWIPDPHASIKPGVLNPARLRDATVLLDPDHGVYDVSDIGLTLERLIRSRDGQRLVAIGNQRVVVFDAKTGARLAQVDNDQVSWTGHAFEAPNGLIVVAGAVFGPTNGSVWPYVLSISVDGKTATRQDVQAQMIDEAVGVTANCGGLLVGLRPATGETWKVQRYDFGVQKLAEPADIPGVEPAPENTDKPGMAAVGQFGSAFSSWDAFAGQSEKNPFTAAGCPAVALDDGYMPGGQPSKGAQVLALEPGLSLEPADHWTQAPAQEASPPSTYTPDCTLAQPCKIIAGKTDETYARDQFEPTSLDQVGPAPVPRWTQKAAWANERIFLDHRVFNSGHFLSLCRRKDGTDVCLQTSVLGEDQLSLPFLRSPDGRYLYWPFGGSAFDLETLQPLTADRVIPPTQGMHYDFEFDRPGLTLALDGRLVSFLPDGASGSWKRVDQERASSSFGILSPSSGQSLYVLASLGSRQYLAVLKDGTLARLDAVTGRELWRITLAGLGEIQAVQLNPERQHALLIGKNSWRVVRLSDGIALSGLLLPPPALQQSAQVSSCQVEDALGPQSQIVATCGKSSFAWQPRMFAGEIEPRLARLTCTANVTTSALDTVRRCYLTRP